MSEQELERNQVQMEEETNVENKLNGRKISWGNLRRVDSLNLEAGRVSVKPAT
jgi:KUP system potassium uptake protein